MADAEEGLFTNYSLNFDQLQSSGSFPDDDNVGSDFIGFSDVQADQCNSMLNASYHSLSSCNNYQECGIFDDAAQNTESTELIFEEELGNKKIEISRDLFSSQESLPRIASRPEHIGNGAILKRCVSPDMFQSEDEVDEQLNASPNIFEEDSDLEDTGQVAVDNFVNIKTSTPNSSHYQPIMPDLIWDDYGWPSIGYSENLSENNNHSRRTSLISEIENLVKDLLQNLMEGKDLVFHIRHMTMSNILIQKDMELYYQDPELMQDQKHVQLAVRDISSLLNATPWELGFRSSSKGLISGSLLITLENDEILDCSSTTEGILLPHETTKIKSLYSTAELVILVEKDTVYKRLVNLDVFARLEKEIILITGKGYPDINTRIIVNKIYNDLKLPIFALVDADPFGIDILLVYRYGSQAMAHNSGYLACPQIRWIGVFPSEIEVLQLSTLPLTSGDKKKISNLLKKSYLTEELRNEILVLKNLGKKSEIEAISSSSDFFIDEYLPRKINLKRS